MRTTRRVAFTILVGGLLAACATGPTLQTSDQAQLENIQSYLNDMTVFEAQFTQAASDGQGAAQGRVWVERPGHLRVQYDEPSSRLILASHGRVLMVDPGTGESSRMPLAKTPLDILLQKTITFSGPVMVKSFLRFPNATQITLVKRDNQTQGALTLNFSNVPLAVTGMTVQDAYGHMISLSVSNIQKQDSLPKSLFEQSVSS
jgi:outer membrane lipoprotein-sorting protein